MTDHAELRSAEKERIRLRDATEPRKHHLYSGQRLTALGISDANDDYCRRARLCSCDVGHGRGKCR